MPYQEKIVNNVLVSASGITESIPAFGNTAICIDSLFTTGRAGMNFYTSPNPLSKVFFGASCLCGVIGATSSGLAVVTSFVGIPMGAWLGATSARGFNSLGKYTLKMGKVTSGNITNLNEIQEFVS